MKPIYFLMIMFFITYFSEAQTKRFYGALFEIDYPSGFQVNGSIRSASNAYESVFFKSPDGQVEFYVYAPGSISSPYDIDIRNNEKMQGSQTKVVGKQEITYWTIADKKGAYTRTYQEILESKKYYWVIGLKFINQSAYNLYKPEYLKFKSSFVRKK